MIGKMQQEAEDWLGSIPRDWGILGWWLGIIKDILLVVLVLFLVLSAFRILERALSKSFKKLVSVEVNVVPASQRLWNHTGSEV